MKVVVTGDEQKVVGIHVIGMGADEMMQGFGVAMQVSLLTHCTVGSCVVASSNFRTYGEPVAATGDIGTMRLRGFLIWDTVVARSLPGDSPWSMS